MNKIEKDQPQMNLNVGSTENLKKENLMEICNLEAIFSDILRSSAIDMAELTKMVDENHKISNLGKKTSEILQTALSKFEENASEYTGSKNFLKKKTRT